MNWKTEITATVIKKKENNNHIIFGSLVSIISLNAFCLCISTGTLKPFHPSLKANPNSYLWEATVSAISVKGDVRSEARKHTSTLDQLSLGWLIVSHWPADPSSWGHTRWGSSMHSPHAYAGAVWWEHRTSWDQQQGQGICLANRDVTIATSHALQ